MSDWSEFYVMVGGAAAALTGLVLVAVSLHARAILAHPLYRDRSFTSLQGLVTILVLACAMLVPQAVSALGIEILVLGVLWLLRFVGFIRLFRRARRRVAADDRRTLWAWEWATWTSWDASLFVSGALLLVGDTRALYVLAAWAAAGFALIVWNAWVLVAEVSG